MQKKVFVSSAATLFAEFSRQQGNYSEDTGTTFVINHTKRDIGTGPIIKLNCKIGEKSIVFIGSRLSMGKLATVAQGSTQPGMEILPSRDAWLVLFDPVNSIGMNFDL